MDAIMEIARRRDLIVIEDACRRGGHDGRKFASIVTSAASSFTTTRT